MSQMGRRDALKLAAGIPFLLASEGAPSPSRPAPSQDHVGPWLEIDQAAVLWNVSQIRKESKGRPVMAVVKANGYGHGVVEVGKILERARVDALAVGTISEALSLRASGITVPILNFGPFSPASTEELVRANVAQTVYTDDVDALAAASRKLNKRAGVHLKIDTGLGRVGVPHSQAILFIEKLASTPEVKIEGVFSALTEDEDFDRVQLARFLEVVRTAKSRGLSLGLRHLASSAGVLAFPAAHLDMVRPGIMVYGEYPSAKEYRARKLDLRPALTLKAKVAYVKKLNPGDSVSYHRKFTAKSETVVATLPVGYSDGYSHRAAGRGAVIIRGTRCPIIDVTANHTTVNVTNSGSPTEIGDVAVLMGRQEASTVTAQEVAEWAGTSSYKTLIHMSPHLPRVVL